MMNKCRNTNKICRFSENGRRKKERRKVLKRADDVSSARAGAPRGGGAGGYGAQGFSRAAIAIETLRKRSVPVGVKQISIH